MCIRDRGRDRAQIAKDIDAYNAACKDITLAHKGHYLDIKDSTRKNGTTPVYLAEDGLHPSGKEYKIWTERLAPMVTKAVSYTHLDVYKRQVLGRQGMPKLAIFITILQ